MFRSLHGPHKGFRLHSIECGQVRVQQNALVMKKIIALSTPVPSGYNSLWRP